MAANMVEAMPNYTALLLFQNNIFMSHSYWPSTFYDVVTNPNHFPAARRCDKLVAAINSAAGVSASSAPMAATFTVPQTEAECANVTRSIIFGTPSTQQQRQQQQQLGLSRWDPLEQWLVWGPIRHQHDITDTDLAEVGRC